MVFIQKSIFLLTYCFTVCYTQYQNNGYIHVLDSSNFTKFVSSQPTVVQFYLNYCGSCHSYAPVFKNISLAIKDWQWAVKLAVIDCASDANGEISKRENVTYFPALKFFSPMKTSTPFPQLFTAEELREEVVLALANTSDILRKFSISKDLSENDLILSGNDAFSIAMIILDLHDYLPVSLKSNLDDEFGEDRYSLLSSFHSPLIFNVSEVEIRKYLLINYGMKNKTIPVLDPEENPRIITPESLMPPLLSVYAADIYASLKHTLKVEVSRKAEIRGEDMQALKEFIKVLSMFLPLHAYVNDSIAFLNKEISTLENISSSAWLSLLRDSSFPTADVSYVACRGSQPHFRGYPCGLWVMFHVMTVQRLLLSSVTGGSLPSVAHALNRFVPRFFSCNFCAFHFASLTSNVRNAGESLFPDRKEPHSFKLVEPDINTLPARPETFREEVLWLNLVHNLVNKRLAGRPSEDPISPKIIFPSSKQCPNCWSSNRSQSHDMQPFPVFPDMKDELLAFLIHHYRQSSWRWTGLPISYREFPQSVQDGSHKSVFTTFDLFLAVFVSITSTALVFGLFYFIFFMRRKRTGYRLTASA